MEYQPDNKAQLLTADHRQSSTGLQWQDLCLTVKDNNKQILKDCYGHVRPGELVGIMGSSGAGKTTLLNLLASRQEKNCEVKGNITLNGKPAIGSVLRQQASFVSQTDTFHVNLTPRRMICANY